jgi:hypothetical protein
MLYGPEAGFSANSVEGGLLRYGMGDRSLGDKTGQWAADKVGGGTTGAVAKTLVSMFTNDSPIGFMVNGANAASDAVSHQLQAGVDCVKNGDGLVGWLANKAMQAPELITKNPALAAIGLGGGKPAEGVGGRKAPHQLHHLAGGIGGGLSPLLRGPAEGGGRGH